MRKNAAKGVEVREPSYPAGGNTNWRCHHRRQHGSSPKQLKAELACDPAIPLLGICLEKTVIRKDKHTRKITAAPFTVAKT